MRKSPESCWASGTGLTKESEGQWWPPGWNQVMDSRAALCTGQSWVAVRAEPSLLQSFPERRPTSSVCPTTQKLPRSCRSGLFPAFSRFFQDLKTQAQRAPYLVGVVEFWGEVLVESESLVLLFMSDGVPSLLPKIVKGKGTLLVSTVGSFRKCLNSAMRLILLEAWGTYLQ